MEGQVPQGSQIERHSATHSAGTDSLRIARRAVCCNVGTSHAV